DVLAARTPPPPRTTLFPYTTLFRSENKPVFLSIGYSSCHWCHVMEHESFESDAIAKLLNENFVSIKVDRNEVFVQELRDRVALRSEEHTSELQSRFDLVCRLLLEKK